MSLSKQVCQPAGQSTAKIKSNWAERIKSLGTGLRRSTSFVRGAAAIVTLAAGAYMNPAMAVLSCSSVYAIDRAGELLEVGEDGSLTPVSATPLHGSAGTGFNPFGVSSGGEFTYAGRQYVETAYGVTHQPGTVRIFDGSLRYWYGNSPAPASPIPEGDLVGGAVNPVNGWFYMAGSTGRAADLNTWYLFAYNPLTPDAPAISIGTITNALGGNGDIAFDSQGNLYLLAGDIRNTIKSQIFRVGQVPPHAGSAQFPATAIAQVGISDNQNTVGIAFNSSGQLVTSSYQGFFQWFNPLTGELIRSAQASPAPTNDIVDLGSCAEGNTVTLRKNLPDGRFANTDQFTLQISGGGLPGVGSGDNLSVTTTGIQQGIQDAVVGPLLALDGVTLTINEVAAGTTNLDDYTRSWICIDEANNDAEVGSGNSLPGTFTMPTPDPALGASVVCTIRNELDLEPSLFVKKLLPNGRKQSGDQFTLQIAQGGSILSSNTTTGATNNPFEWVVVNSTEEGGTYMSRPVWL